jgi:DNA (cytosine-5)-methyltransferase 1
MTFLTSIDLFAGAGGLSCGLKAEGFKVLAAVENDPISAKTYELNHRSTNVLVDDIRNITGSHLLKVAGIAPGELDLLTGCPPCQSFSTLRTRRRTSLSSQPDDPSKNLILEILRLARSVKPRSIIVENVPGLANDIHFADFQLGLKKAGYQFEYAVINASDFGLPQRRKRLIFVALKGMTVPQNWLSFKGKKTTVRTAISRLAPAGSSGDVLHDIPENRTKAMVERIQATPKNGGSRHDIASDFQCACHNRTNGFKDVYGRMEWDEVSPTITSGCNNPSRGRFLHPEEDRAITLREAALLQTFPRKYQFCLERGKEHVARQIGNAFPPSMIRPIARIIKSELLV